MASLIMALAGPNVQPVSMPSPIHPQGILSFMTPTAEAANEPELVSSSMTEDQIKELIEKYAVPLHVKQSSMLATIQCEAPRADDGAYDPMGRSAIIDEKGELENSWGIAQINLDYHPEITREQAQNPDFSVSFMATKFAKGNADRWSCWRKLKKSGKI